MKSFSIVLIAIVAMSQAVLAGDHTVKGRPGQVAKDGQRDAVQTEQTNPEAAAEVAGMWEIRSQTFKPGVKRAFKEFESGGFVDIIDNIAGTITKVTDESSAAVQVTRAIPLEQKDADNWPIILEGNLRPTGEGNGGGGTPPELYWAVKIGSGTHSTNVTFSEDPVITGFSLPAEASTISAVVTAIVTPAEDVENIEFVIEGENRAEHTVEGEPNAETGEVVLRIFGRSATPSDKPAGDTTLVAKKNSNSVGQTQVVVVIPASHAKPYPSHDGPIAGKRRLLNKTTSPPDHSVQGDQSAKFRQFDLYFTNLSMQSLDQFDDPLHEVYEGQGVDEITDGGPAIPINQTVKSSGKYDDPMGFGIDGNIADISIPEIKQLMDVWLAQPAEPIPNNAPVGTFNVRVLIAGHALSPDTKRTFTPTAPDRVKIEIEDLP